ncbi:MAG: hypothetical protein UFT36_07130 [Collinsella sp.]|nr:hypothetical protein [Collinsella sp.]
MDCKKKPEPFRSDTFIGYMGYLGVNALFNAESETSATGVDPAVLRGIGYCAGIAQSAFDEPRDFTPEELNAVISYAMRCEEEFKSKGAAGVLALMMDDDALLDEDNYTVTPYEFDEVTING